MHERRRFLRGAAALAAAPLATACGGTPDRPAIDVRSFGATGDGVTLDTAAIQATVDAAAASGGGVVHLPAGRFLSGTVVLRSDVTLRLARGAVLLGSTDIADYPAHELGARDLDVGGRQVWALLHAEGAERVVVEGDGTIDGQGAAFPKVPFPDPGTAAGPRPRMIFFRNCRGVELRDVVLREAGIWTVHLAQCETVRVRDLEVTSSVHVHQDGIVLDSCHDALVTDCRVDTLDDAIVLKSAYPQPCSQVTVTRCAVTSRCAGLKLGTQSLGGFRDVTISHCTLVRCRLGGLKLQTVDGGDLCDVTVHDLVMRDVAAPISLRRGARGFDFGDKQVQRPRPVGALRRVSISRVRAVVSADPEQRAGWTMSVAGIPGHPVEDVVLSDVEVVFPGGGTPAEAARVDIPEEETAYPEHTMFGVLPASGLWMRHAAGITLRDVRLRTATPDARPALVHDDVVGLRVSG